MSAKNKQELRVTVHGPCSSSSLPSPLHPPNWAYTPVSGLPLSAYKPQFSPSDFPLYTPLSARMSAYPRTPLHWGFPPTPAGSSDDCPLDLNTPFETSTKYLRDFDNFFSTKLFRQNGDVASKVLPPPPNPHMSSPRVEFFKRDKLPSFQKTMLKMRDFETSLTSHGSDWNTSKGTSTSSSTCTTLVRNTPTDEMVPNYVTSNPESPGSDSDSSCFSSASPPQFKLTSPPMKKLAFRPYKVQKPKPAAAAAKKQLAVEMVAGHVGLVKKEHSTAHAASSPSPADSPFGRGMAPSTNGMSNVERLKANPDMWTQATQVKKGVYVCTHCPSHLGRFRKLSELAAHFDEHNLTRLCKCDFPDCAWSIVGFSSRSEKTRHIKSQHATARYECLHCERVFARSDSLKRHFKLIHNLPNVSPEELLSMRTNAPSSANTSVTYDAIKEEDHGAIKEEHDAIVQEVHVPTMPPPSSTSIFVVAQS